MRAAERIQNQNRFRAEIALGRAALHLMQRGQIDVEHQRVTFNDPAEQEAYSLVLSALCDVLEPA